MNFRTVKVSDYDIISPVINDWWGGRQMADLLPKLFFVHFNNTSFVAEEDGKIVGFLIGFLSQTFPEEAYIHFVGVDPDYRKQKIGRQLYDMFFSVVKENGRDIVRCITSQVNKNSIAYHKRMGFEIENTGNNGDKIYFVKKIR